jgi:hypothetical protein
MMPSVPDAELLALARTLPIPIPWDRRQFVDTVAQMRRRPIRLIPTPTAMLTDSPCGLWLKRDHDDIVIHEIGTSEYHMDQIICHEIGHMVLGHDRGTPDEQSSSMHTDLCTKLLPNVDPAAVQAVLGRTDYASAQERDAEMFASMLMVAAAEADAPHSVMHSVFFHPR